MSDPLARVFITAHSQYRFLLIRIAERLKARHGVVIHLYASTPQEVDFYRANSPDGLFESVVNAGVLYSAIRERPADEAAVLEKAKAHEAWLGLTYNELAVSDRHLGRGYALGGFHHPRSRHSEGTSYLQMLHGYNQTLDFWKRELAEKRPTLIIGAGKPLAAVARAEGIPVRMLAGARYKNHHYWAHNECFETPAVQKAYARLADAPEAELSEPYHSHMVFRKVFIRQTSLLGSAKRIAELALRHFYWRLRGYEKAKGYYLGDNIAYILRKRRDTKRLIGRRALQLGDLEGRRFVYYPLHTEPEVALQTASPEYFYQLSLIAALSRDLPAGIVLAVKDTYEAVGRRPDNFYDQIAAFKNVVLLDMMELGLEVVRRATAVVTITGTAGFEAAVMGKPVITFGRHNVYNFLPHVIPVTDESELKGYLAAALDGSIGGERARRDGQRFLKAVIETSFDLGGFNFVEPESFDVEAVDGAYRTLMESFDETAADEAA